MNATGSDAGSPFLDGLDSDVTAPHRPQVDDEVMRRLRTPFEADPADLPNSGERPQERRQPTTNERRPRR
ncbi:hypothetical protein GCM10023322_28420 [Rugosimonospora acidiphila]|uniref:Uncharacterized protein n=1 Tax=Rugosimonospora acidiphila TaxID=556531 RepID=A0ABP9RS65_9ACTN